MQPNAQLRFSPLLTTLVAALSLYGCGDGGSDCGGPLCIGPPEQPQASRLRPASGDGQTGAPGRELPQPIAVVVTDDEDRPVADVAVSFTVGQGGGSLSESVVQSDIQGHALVKWVLGPDPGVQNLQVAAEGEPGTPLDGSPLIVSAEAVRPPPARIILRTGPPDAAQNGVAFAQQPVVQVLDGDDQPVPQVQVVASIASGEGALSGTTAVTSGGTGLAAYSDLAIIGTTGPRTLRFSVIDPALEVTSGIIQLNAGTATQMVGVEPLVYQGTVGSPVSPAPSVLVKDAAGNPVPGVAVSFTPDRDASVSPTAVVTDENGIAQVTSWTLGTTANVQYSLTASVPSTSLAPVVFSATPRAGSAGRLQIVTQPAASAQNGAPLPVQPVIQVTDQNGNPAPQRVRITATVSSGPGTLSNAVVTSDASGRAEFTGLTITGTVGSYTIGFSATGLTGVTSTPITLAPGSATQLALVSGAPSARSRFLIAPQPSIQVQDASGNPVPQPGIPIVASLTGDGRLDGQATATTDVTGRATYVDLVIIGAPGPRTLNFSSPELETASVPVTLPAPATIELSTPPPSSAVVGTQVIPGPTWILKDAAGQTVSDVPVVLSTSAGGSVQPTSGASGDGGGVQVTTWTLATTAGDQFVQLTVTGTELTDTVHIEATSGPPVALQKISGDAQTDTVNAELDSLLVVRVTDSYGNGVEGVEITWQACEGGDVLTDSTNAEGYSGVVQPTGPTAGNFCTRASAAGLQSVEFTYTVTAGTTSPSQVRTNESSIEKPRGPVPVAPQRRLVGRPDAW